MDTKDIRQTVRFKGATPYEVYELLMDEKKHAAFTGAAANISREVGGEARMYDGWIEAMNLELKPDEKIVQKWRGGDWDAGHYSTVMFEFAPVEDGTEVTFSQTGVPANWYEDISKGWHTQYWDKMRGALKKRGE